MRDLARVVGFTLATGAAVARLAARGLDQAPADRPLNVLLLVIDDARWDTVGAAGNPVVQTPRLDRLAAEGIRFDNAFVRTKPDTGSTRR